MERFWFTANERRYEVIATVSPAIYSNQKKDSTYGMLFISCLFVHASVTVSNALLTVHR